MSQRPSPSSQAAELVLHYGAVGQLVQNAYVERRLGLVVCGVIIAVLVAGPISLLLTGLLLPGDPDDPNAKALALGLATAVPAGIAAAGMYAVVPRVSRTGRVGRATLAAHVRTATPLAAAGFLLLLAWPVALATPAPETAEQATEGPYLWRDGAVRMTAAALMLLIFSASLAMARKVRSRHDLPPVRVEEHEIAARASANPGRSAQE